MMKNDFHFMLKAFFVLEIIIFLSRRIGFVERRLDKKTKVNFKIHDFADWTTNNYNTHIDQYFKK